MRIVSLIASATEMVHALGLGEFQIGRSHECDFPEATHSLPVCTRPRFDISGTSAEIDRLVKETLRDAGSVYEVFEDLLVQLAPTHILTQSQCRVCAVSVEDVEQAMGDRFPTRPRVVALEPNSMAEIRQDLRRIGEACGVLPRAESFVGDMDQRMKVIADQCRRGSNHPRVAMVEWMEPLMSAGNWMPELVEMAAANNLFGEAGKHSPWMEWEQLIASDPDVVIVSPCGFGLERTRADLRCLTENPHWRNLRAVQQDRVYLVDGNQYFHRPGPRVVESLSILAEILHPHAFEPTMSGTAWELIRFRQRDSGTRPHASK